MADPISLAAVTAIGSTALETVGSVRASKQQERQAERNAQIGETRAKQIDVAFRDELNRTLGNIDAIRASTGTSGFSPTAVAIRERERETSDRNRQTRVGSERLQALQSKEDARFFRASAKFALLGAPIKAFSRFASSGGSFGAPS